MALEREKTRNIKVLEQLWPLLWRYRTHVVGACVALVFTAVITLSMGQGLRYVIDRGFTYHNLALFNQGLLMFAVLVVLLAAGTYTRFYLVSWLGERVSADLRQQVFAHIIHLHPGFFESNFSGEIQSRITVDTTVLQTVIGSSVSIALRNILMALGGVIFLFVTNPKLTGLVLLSVPLVVTPIMYYGRRVRGLSRLSQDSIADLGGFVTERLQQIKTVQAFNHEASDSQRFSNYVETAFDIAIRRIGQRAVLIALVILLVLGAIGVMLWIGGHDVLQGRNTPGQLAAFVFYAIIVAGSVGAISEVWTDLQRAAGATERLLELLASQNLIQDPATPAKLAAQPRGDLKFENLSFKYPSRPTVTVLDHINFAVAPGESVALVGPSGAGKTTVFELLMRFYPFVDGRILLDGIDVRNLTRADLRACMALVSQQPAIFNTSIAENIRYGRLDATDAEIMAAARSAYALEFIERLPEGMQTKLGENGAQLSGGQRQRLAIARAILRNPSVLLLDEATSALDAESEHQVQQALAALTAERTTLIIAHRLATVQHVDRIVVMEHGKVIATGSHATLLESCSLYARLAALQFRDVVLS